MSVICFASLKGGVGKTSLSLNVAHAFAQRGCQTLLIDCDPTGHGSRLFHKELSSSGLAANVSPLARLFLSEQLESRFDEFSSLLDEAEQLGLPLLFPVRGRVDLCPSGPELRHFLWGRGARVFKNLFKQLIQELRSVYDYIVIDTPPDFNVLTRNAIAVSDLIVVPVDSSEMSIHCLEEIVTSAAHIKGPMWAIVRSMISRNASRVQQLTNSRLEERLSLAREKDDDEVLDDSEPDLECADAFISLLKDRESEMKKQLLRSEGRDDSPIYLLNSLVYRTEQQNRLTFIGKTAFDARVTSKLATEYLALARELEQLLSIVSESEEPMSMNDDLVTSLGMMS